MVVPAIQGGLRIKWPVVTMVIVPASNGEWAIRVQAIEVQLFSFLWNA